MKTQLFLWSSCSALIFDPWNKITQCKVSSALLYLFNTGVGLWKYFDISVALSRFSGMSLQEGTTIATSYDICCDVFSEHSCLFFKEFFNLLIYQISSSSSIIFLQVFLTLYMWEAHVSFANSGPYWTYLTLQYHAGMMSENTVASNTSTAPVIFSVWTHTQLSNQILMFFSNIRKIFFVSTQTLSFTIAKIKCGEREEDKYRLQRKKKERTD